MGTRIPAPARRKLTREVRREQIIDATLAELALRGYARVTLADIARRAGMSQALVNFHFATKDRLLADTLLFLDAEYRENWQRACAEAEPHAAAQIEALIRADFREPIYTRERLAAWCAFWGETRSRPLYQEICGANHDLYNLNLQNLCASLLAGGGYPGDPGRVARAIRTLVEGIWLDILTMRSPYGVDEALGTVYTCLAAFFPAHFSATGRIPLRVPAKRSRQ